MIVWAGRVEDSELARPLMDSFIIHVIKLYLRYDARKVSIYHF